MFLFFREINLIFISNSRYLSFKAVFDGCPSFAIFVSAIAMLCLVLFATETGYRFGCSERLERECFCAGKCVFWVAMQDFFA